MSTFVPFRLTVDNQFTDEEFTNFLKKHSGVVMVHETADTKDPLSEIKPHYHGYFLGGCSKQSVIHWLKTELNCTGNKQYSMTTKSLKENPGIDGYRRYICKGYKDFVPKHYFGLTKEEVLELHTNFWESRAKFIAKRKNEKLSVKLKLLEYYKENVSGYETHRGDYTFVVRIILGYYKDSDTPVSSNVIENMYHYVRTMTEDNYIDQRAANLYERITKFETFDFSKKNVDIY